MYPQNGKRQTIEEFAARNQGLYDICTCRVDNCEVDAKLVNRVLTVPTSKPMGMR